MAELPADLTVEGLALGASAFDNNPAVWLFAKLDFLLLLILGIVMVFHKLLPLPFGILAEILEYTLLSTCHHFSLTVFLHTPGPFFLLNFICHVRLGTLQACTHVHAVSEIPLQPHSRKTNGTPFLFATSRLATQNKGLFL